MTWSHFRQKISASFNIDELHTLCFDMGLDYEAISGENKDAKIRELIELLQRQKRMSELVGVLEKVRPNENWNKILQASETHEASTNKRHTIGVVAGIVILLLITTVGGFSLMSNDSEPEAVSSSVIAEVTTTPIPTYTAVPSSTPAPTDSPIIEPMILSPTSTLPPTIAPVDEGKYMVLVAQLEPLTSNERDVTRFIVDDLEQTLVANIPYSKIQIREYPEIITSQDDARAIAEEVGAPIIIWGNYDDAIAEVNISVGTVNAFPTMPFEQNILEQIVNVRVRMTNEREESVAKYVTGLMASLLIASGEEIFWSSVLLSDINVISAQLNGDNIITKLYKWAEFFYDNDLENAKIELDAAYELDSGNPIIYYYRGLTYAKLGELDSAKNDIQTAIRIGPDNWASVHEIAGALSLYENDGETALEHFRLFQEARPNDDWRPHYEIGVAYFIDGDYTNAQLALEESISLEPNVNWPYLFLLQIYLREGRLLDALALGQEVLVKFPDPTYGNRVFESSISANFLGPLLSGMGNVLIGQSEEASKNIDLALQYQTGPIADMLWIKGFTKCQLGDLELAEEFYSAAIEQDSSFVLPYLNRAGIRLRLDNTVGAEEDFQAIRDSELAASFALVIPFAQSGQLTCDNFLDFNPLNPPPIPEKTVTP